MTTERARAEHAAKYDKNLIVPAREYLALLDENEQLRTAAQKTEETPARPNRMDDSPSQGSQPSGVPDCSLDAQTEPDCA